MRPDRRILIAAALTIGAAGCTSATSKAPRSAGDGPLPTVTLPAPAASVGSAPVDQSTPPDPTTIATGTSPALSPAAGGVVAVSGGGLPAAIVAAINSHGGELADPTVWAARYGTFGLPTITGNGVRLTAAKIDLTRAPGGGWQRTDELQWLLRDTTHPGIGGLLDAVTTAAGAGTLLPDTADTTDQGADCVTRTLHQPPGATGPGWRIEGCAYPKYPGLFAVGVTRTGLFADTATSVPNVEPSTHPVTTALNGTVQTVSVAFDRPTTTGSVTTLTTKVTIRFAPTALDVTGAVRTLVAGPLAGWQQFPGDGSTMLAGIPGASWVIGAGSATFTGEGRLDP